MFIAFKTGTLNLVRLRTIARRHPRVRTRVDDQEVDDQLIMVYPHACRFC